MGVICDYFVAPSDEIAAASVSEGPSERLPAELASEVVDGTGIMPVVEMCSLEALLTARTYAEVRAERRGDEPVAMEDDGGRVVVRLAASLVQVLAAAEPERLETAARQWSETAELARTDAGPTVQFAERLAALARLGSGRGFGLYCWICV
ncbi:MAG TPA: hypothetical protein VMD59_09460 [Acidimicrobiales bacterium]|nr:hypothetical protein [Acidimicrobiales bacterium]